MTLVRLRERAQITLPQEVRNALRVKQGDYLEAEIVEGGVLLRPTTVIDRDASRARLQALFADGRQGTDPAAKPSDDDVMQDALAAISDSRRERREDGPR